MLNRKAIRAALANYKLSVKQSDEILKDQEVQGLFRKEKNEEAVSLYTKRYPMGGHKVLSKNRIILIESMIKDVPTWKGMTADDILEADWSIFNKLVELAEQV